MANQLLARIVANPLARAYTLALLRYALTAAAAWLAAKGYIMNDQIQQVVGLVLAVAAGRMNASDVKNVDAKITAALSLPHDATADAIDKVKQS